jgi:transposase
MQPPKILPLQPYTRESLQALDPETLINLYLSLDVKYKQLGDYVRQLVTEKYGQKNERFENPDQLQVFPGNDAAGEATATADQPSVDAASEKKPSPAKQKKPGHSRNPKPDHLPRVPVLAPAPEESKLPCACCGTTRVLLRHVLQNERYSIVPAIFYIEQLFMGIYGCPKCESADQLAAKVPEAVENGNTAPELQAHVAVQRDFDHLPLNRQSAIFSRCGVNLNRSTLSDMYAQLAAILMPLYLFMHQILLQSKIISTDDTPVKVLDRSKEKNIKLGRKWIYMGDNEHAVNLFDYTTGRGRDGPLTFLKGWIGLLQGDCFSGNLAVCAAIGTVLVACLAHARRYFIKAMLNDKQGCNQALCMFQSLYEIERTAKEFNLSSNDLKVMREQEAVPLLDKFHSWLQQQYVTAQPKSSFAKALFYCLNNWNELTQYVQDGNLKIDNNHSEREMKYVSMGKKAWLFFGSDEGGKNHAIVLSVLSTCRRHGVEPWAYLTDVIRRLTEETHPNLEELLPYNWKQKYPTRQLSEIIVVKDAPKIHNVHPVPKEPHHFGILKQAS